MMKKKKVWLTGMGVVSPLGTGKEVFWRRLLAGESAVDFIQAFDASSFPTQLAAEVRDFEPEKFLSARQQKIYSRMTQFAVAAGKMAVEDAGLSPAEIDPFRTNVLYGSGVSAFDVIDEALIRNNGASIEEFNPEAVDALSAAKSVIHNPSIALGLTFGVEGFVSTMSTACGSGINTVGFAAQRIEAGQADVVLTGGGDTPISRLLWSAFCGAGMFTESRDPKNALCPFDARRTKGTLAEGAVIFVLEEAEHARARGATPYAQVTGFDEGADNVNELFMPERSGKKWTGVMERALSASGRKKPDYICAHGPSDKLVDKAEVKALKQALPKTAAKTAVSSVKGQIGSGMATAGALQVAAAALAMRHGQIPSVYNYQEEDPDCDLKFVTHPKKKNLKKVLINAKAIGGINSALVLEKARL